MFDIRQFNKINPKPVLPTKQQYCLYNYIIKTVSIDDQVTVIGGSATNSGDMSCKISQALSDLHNEDYAEHRTHVWEYEFDDEYGNDPYFEPEKFVKYEKEDVRVKSSKPNKRNTRSTYDWKDSHFKILDIYIYRHLDSRAMVEAQDKYIKDVTEYEESLIKSLAEYYQTSYDKTRELFEKLHEKNYGIINDKLIKGFDDFVGFIK